MTSPPAATVDLDEFRLVRVLGQGGMGSVYLGYDTVLERDVAIKVLRERADEDARLRFLTEARAIARLDHPNVIAIFRASTTRDGHPYIVQELVRGHSLDAISRPVAPRRVLEIALGTARGLAAAHRRGILHRDIKPANIMIDDTGTPKLLDFGVAKLTQLDEVARASSQRRPPRRTGVVDVADTAPGPSVSPAIAVDAVTPSDRETAAGTVVGTPRYVAPEIWLGRPATVRSDLYSLGALLYELAAGAPPFPQTQMGALVEAVLDGPQPPALATAASGLDAELAAIITACLSRDPELRPESADEVVHRVERIIAGAPPVPDGNPYPGLAPFAAEHRAVFYGRGGDISAVVDRLRSDPLVVVAGDSGIGKSSLCRAGAVPAVVAGALGDARAWHVRPVTVGRHAMSALREAEAAEPPVRGAGTLWWFDQFEQLVTLNEPREAAEAARVVAELARGTPGVKVLIAVRGDFLTRVAALPGLGPAMMRSLHLLRVLSLSDARDAVVGPARAKGVRFETDAMVETLASSIADEPGALPLLSFALAELWQRRDLERAVIPVAALDAIGGVAGGLARHASGVIGALAATERAAARRIALQLVTAAGTRAERERRELCPDDDPAAAAALEAMIRGRLVVARNTAAGEPTYELAHDSLITAWSTLSGWRDDAAGQRGLRIRLAAAADEWRRLGRRADTLWNRAQLAEIAQLDDLADADLAFLAASRRAVRRGAAIRFALAASLPAVALATWLVVHHVNQAARDRDVAVHVERATARLRDAGAARDAAARDRSAAFHAFDTNRTVLAESLWRRVRGEVATAHAAYSAATSELDAAVLVDGQRADVRSQLAQAIMDHALAAEADRDQAAANDIATRLVAFDDPALVAAWRRPAELAVSAPGAAQIELRRYVDRDGALELGPAIATSLGDRLARAVDAGSYLIELRGSGGAVVHYPVLVARAEWLALDIAVPRATDIPAGMIYVPAGRFLFGGVGNDLFRQSFLSTAPLHAITTPAYLIARTEVTFGDWMAYLRAVPAAEREARRPRMTAGTGTVAILGGGDRPGEPFTLTFQATSTATIAREGEPLVFPERTRHREVRWEAAPVSGISFDDAAAYAAWLAATGRVRGARLCSDVEWERAARGADGRTWPHGDRLDDDDANIDVTYERKTLAYGPDEVGSHPRSTSPFGIVDAAGNALEWVAGPDGTAVQRGGSWWHTAATAESANRDLTDPSLRLWWLGTRICATPEKP